MGKSRTEREAPETAPHGSWRKARGLLCSPDRPRYQDRQAVCPGKAIRGRSRPGQEIFLFDPSLHHRCPPVDKPACRHTVSAFFAPLPFCHGPASASRHFNRQTPPKTYDGRFRAIMRARSPVSLSSDGVPDGGIAVFFDRPWGKILSFQVGWLTANRALKAAAAHQRAQGLRPRAETGRIPPSDRGRFGCRRDRYRTALRKHPRPESPCEKTQKGLDKREIGSYNVTNEY